MAPGDPQRCDRAVIPLGREQPHPHHPSHPSLALGEGCPARGSWRTLATARHARQWEERPFHQGAWAEGCPRGRTPWGQSRWGKKREI